MTGSFNTPHQSATSSNGGLNGAEANANGSKNHENLTQVHTERFGRAYNQIGTDRTMKTNNDKLSFAGVVSLATEYRPQRPMLQVAFQRSNTVDWEKETSAMCYRKTFSR